jgi:hypothetical protein
MNGLRFPKWGGFHLEQGSLSDIGRSKSESESKCAAFVRKRPIPKRCRNFWPAVQLHRSDLGIAEIPQVCKQRAQKLLAEAGLDEGYVFFTNWKSTSPPLFRYQRFCAENRRGGKGSRLN